MTLKIYHLKVFMIYSLSLFIMHFMDKPTKLVLFSENFLDITETVIAPHWVSPH